MTMTDLANRSGVSLTTVRELVHALSTRRRQPRILGGLSRALGWPEDHLVRVLRGGTHDEPSPEGPEALKALQEEVRELRDRVDALEDRGDLPQRP
ncbi:MAG: hypothetical protein ACRDPK_01560 [Carbonactinosporaceae bacterium]